MPSSFYIFAQQRRLHAVRSGPARPPLPLRPLHAWLLLACLAMVPAGAAQAQTPTASAPSAASPAQASTPLALTPSPWLAEELPAAAPQAPSFISGNKLDGEIDRHVTATGQAEVRKPGSVLKGDVIRYDQSSNTLSAQGHVRLNQMGNVFRGDKLQLQLDSYEGSLDNVTFHILQTGGAGKAGKIDFIDREHGIIHNALYTGCYSCSQKLEKTAETSASTEDWNPSWYVRGERIYLDTQEDTGYVENGALVFGGVPILPVSNFSFPLSDKRRSGLLPPTVQYNSNSGLVYSQPYYFNIAPNRDATVASNISTRRGIDLYGQFRYLEPTYHGKLDLNVMPNDRLTGTKRWRYTYTHNQHWATPSFGAFNLALDLGRVSDNTYWRDFQDIGSHQGDRAISERLLPSTGTLSWSLGHWSAFLREQRWQTLQLPAPDNITPPFDLSPQIHLRYARDNVAGFDVALDLDSTRFRSDPALTGYPNGTRNYAHARISYPWLQPWGFITPTLEWHATHYHTDTPWKVLEYAAALGELNTIIVENMERQAKGLHG